MLKKQKNTLLKSLEEEIEKTGPMKCLVYGAFLSGLSYYFRYYKVGLEVIDGNYTNALIGYFAGLPIGVVSDICLLGGGYVEGKKIFKKIKNRFYKN